MTRAVLAMLAAACALLGCTDLPKPLLTPLAPELALADGLRIALLDADLQPLADTIRLAAGKSVDVPVAEWLLPNPSDGQFTALTVAVPLDGLTLAWPDAQHLRATAQFGKIAAVPSLVLTGEAGCALSWDAQSLEIATDLEVVRDANGALTVQAAGAPVATWTAANLTDASACLAKQPAPPAASLDAHLRAAIAAQLVERLHAVMLPTLAAIFAPSVEQSGRVTAAAVEARFALQYTDDAGHVAAHVGTLAQANLAVSLDVDRHPCAVDAQLPMTQASPLAQRSPPAGQAFVRRALVLDLALVQRLAWMAARSGALCAQSRTTLTTTLVPGWAADLLPQVDEWIEGPPTGARFWPGSSPTVQFVDTPTGAALQWTMDDGQLEIIARVADTEMTVLTVTGGFRATLVPRLEGAHLLAFDLVTVERLSTHQSSPLLGDLATPPSEAALSALCEAALQGIFAQQAVLPLLPLTPGPLPAGTVLTRIDRAGDALWLWLEGGTKP